MAKSLLPKLLIINEIIVSGDNSVKSRRQSTSTAYFTVSSLVTKLWIMFNSSSTNEILEPWSNRFSPLFVSTHVSLPYNRTKVSADIFAGRRNTYLQMGLFAVSPNPRRSLLLQELPSTQIRWRLQNYCRVKNRPISSRNHEFCSLFVDLQSVCLQC
jgi:hypothetical protein